MLDYAYNYAENFILKFCVSELGGRRLDTLRTINYKIEARPRVMFLRVSYVLCKDHGPGHIPMPAISVRTFMPAVTVDRSCCGEKDYEFETMKQTMDRMAAWLHEAGKCSDNSFVLLNCLDELS